MRGDGGSFEMAESGRSEGSALMPPSDGVVTFVEVSLRIRFKGLELPQGVFSSTRLKKVEGAPSGGGVGGTLIIRLRSSMGSPHPHFLHF